MQGACYSRRCDREYIRPFCTGKAYQADSYQHIESRDCCKPSRHTMHAIKHHDGCDWNQRRQNARNPVSNAIDRIVLVADYAMFTRGFHEPGTTTSYEVEYGILCGPHRKWILLRAWAQ
jgi:hypothetical protein